MLTTLLATAVVLGVLIFVHELGHFLTAKWADIEVPRFSIGFGPKVVGFRRGETEYVISALPLGGYVKMAGMEELEPIEGPADGAPGVGADSGGGAHRGKRPARRRDFESKSLPVRAFVISAGVIMNILFAFVVWSTIGAVWGVPRPAEPVVGGVAEEALPEGAEALARIPPGTRIEAVGDRAVANFDELRLELITTRPGPAVLHLDGLPPVAFEVPQADTARALLAAAIEPVMRVEPTITGLVEGSPAEAAGLRAGDRVLRAGGRPVETWQEFVGIIETSPGRPVPLRVRRSGEELELSVVPESNTLADGHVYGRIGARGPAAALAVPRERAGPVQAVAYGANETWRWMRLTVQFLGGMFSGRHSVRDVGGPILIGQLSGQVARAGLETFLNFMALLSINLAILNLLPIPVLDGGHLVFLAIEAVRGRALSVEQRVRLSQVGFVVILMIMAFAIGNDVLRWIGL
jgi:regulator of sigma E protease